MDWSTMSEQRKLEYVGFLQFNRLGEDDWLYFDPSQEDYEFSIETSYIEEEDVV